jgi:hypothetical protein
MFHPNNVMAQRAHVSGLPDWEIEMLVDIQGKESWPPMGLVVRNHEIVDDLRRDLFPAELRSFRCPDSRAGPP